MQVIPLKPMTVK